MRDAIVVGLGGMGSAALCHLAAAGADVLGLDRYIVPHAHGASHGRTRILRVAYWEDVRYVPLVQRAVQLWNALGAATGQSIFVRTGSVDAGVRDSRAMSGVIQACEQFNLGRDVMTGPEASRRFPAFRLPSDFTAVFQPDGGVLWPERAIDAHLQLARAAGAQVKMGEAVVDWKDRGDSVEVVTTHDVYQSRKLVITTGPWLAKTVPSLAALLTVERQVVMWVRPIRPELYDPSCCPVAYFHGPRGSFYALPDVDGRGFKIGRYHHLRQVIDPDDLSPECGLEDQEILREGLEQYFPHANGEIVNLSPCLFTNTSDEHFVIDVLPDAPSVVVAGGCSGHAFKFCSVIGEIAGELALSGRSRHDLSMFSLGRFSTRGRESLSSQPETHP